MNKKIARLGFLGILLLCSALLVGMGQKPEEKPIVSIIETSIRDREVLTQNKPLMVSFSGFMVPADKVDKPLQPEEMPFQLSPAVEGEGRWLSQSSFYFSATKGFQRGKKYRVLMKEDLKSLDGSPFGYEYSFSTKAPEVKKLQVNQYLRNSNTLSVRLAFNMALPAAAVQDHLTFEDPATGEKLPFKFSGSAQNRQEFTVLVSCDTPREKVRVQIRSDSENDQNSLGLETEYSALLNIEIPRDTHSGPTVSRVTPESEKNKPSLIAPRNLYSYDDYDTGELVAVAYLREEINVEQDYAPFIKVDPPLSYSLRDSNSVVFTEGLVSGQKLTVTLLPGLMDSKGRVLQESRSGSTIVKERASAVRFPNRAGNVLAASAGPNVPITLVNVGKVRVSLHKIYENNLAFANFREDQQLTMYGRMVGTKEVELSLEKNVPTTRNIDFKEMAGGDRGVFLLDVTGYVKNQYRDDSSYWEYSSNQNLLVSITDIGITTRVFPKGITVFASSLETAKPIADAKVRVLSSSNQLVAEGQTNAEGTLVYEKGDVWDDQLAPAVVTVETETDKSFLPTDYTTALYLSSEGTRDYLSEGYEAFVYTPRGVFRPGEKVQIKTFVRDPEQKAPEPFPVMFVVTSSRDLEVARGSATLSAHGGADFAFDLPGSASTGGYSVSVIIPGQKDKVLGRGSFLVEEFVPPRLEVTVKPSAPLLVSNSTLPVLLDAQYLFGAPGNGLKYELGYRASVTNVVPSGWDGYFFGNHMSKFGTQSNLKYLEGILDAKGLKDVAFTAPSDWSTASSLNVSLFGAVQEESGRWVTSTSKFVYYPSNYLLGLKLGEPDQTKNTLLVDVAAVTPEGEVAAPGVLKVDLLLRNNHWRTIYRNGRYIYERNEQLVPLGKVNVTPKAGKASTTLSLPRYGNYYVRCQSADGKVIAVRSLSYWGSDGYEGSQGSGRMEQVELAFDKTGYAPGETAKLSVKAPYAGTLLLGLEQGSQMNTKVISMPTPETTISVPVTEDMRPNIMVTAWVIRPVSVTAKEWYAHRAYGSTILALSKDAYSLKVVSELPERALPSAPVSIPFTVTDTSGKPVTGEFSVALVDEGILSLTSFVTPSPVDFFMALRNSPALSYDFFHRLIKPEGNAKTLLTAGGDAGSEYQGSLSPQRIFLTAFIPTVITDDAGKGVVEIAIPEYSGKGRLMIVGASGSSFASAASSLRIAREVEVEVSVPRAVAPGDEFELPLKAFVLNKELEASASIKVTTTGPADVVGENTFMLSATDSNKKLRMKAANGVGIAGVDVAVSVEGRPDLTFTKHLEFAVRSPFPRSSSVVFSSVVDGKPVTLPQTAKWVPGSAVVSVSLDTSPVLSVLPALTYLFEYPYGCLEQTTSRAWPYLVLSSIQKQIGGGEDAEYSHFLETAVSRITSLLTSDGGFSMWPGSWRSDPWNSVNTIMFLNQAKHKVAVSQSLLKKTDAYLNMIVAAPVSFFGDNELYTNTTKAYAVFVLAQNGHKPLSWIQHLKKQEAKMYPSGRIFLAAAQALMDGNSKALKLLESSFAASAAKQKYNAYRNESFESHLRNTALRLYVWSLVEPTSSEATRLSIDLAKQLQGKKWFSTQEAGMASLALGTYIEKTNLNKDSVIYSSIKVNGEVIGESKGVYPLIITNNSLVADTGVVTPVEITAEGGNLYGVYTVRGVPLEKPLPVAANLSVQQNWLKDGKPLDLSSGTLTLEKGDRVVVQLTVNAQDTVSNVVLSNVLPGGMEVENPRLATSVSAESGSGGYGVYLDLRDDRVLLFFGYVHGNQPSKYEYTMRAVSSGTFVLPPVAVEGMYNPEASAVSQTGVLIVK